MRHIEVIEHARDHEIDDLIDRLRPKIESGVGWHYDRPGLRDAQHVVEVNGHKVNAMCALDALSVAPMFKVETNIKSSCAITGTPVSILMQGEQVTAVEADVMRFVKLDKDFIGKDATLRSQAGPTPWTCAYLAVEAEDADCHGSEAVFANGARVGAVSSGGYGHSVGTSLAFAYLHPAHAAPDTPLEVMILGARRPARVLGEPAYDPANLHPRQ